MTDRSLSGDASTVTVSKERLALVMDVLSLAAIGQFDHEKCVISIAAEDDFALLEQTLNLFTQELGSARRENERVLGELTASRVALEERLALIQAQQDSIQRLSTPILEVWAGVLVLPVIGIVDSARAEIMTNQLLSEIVRSAAHGVIVDVTGAAEFDAPTADALVRLVKAVSLVGASCVVTGISAENASALVQLGVAFDEIVTRSSLKEGLLVCLKHRNGGVRGAAFGIEEESNGPRIESRSAGHRVR
jgi:rsbT co-antagonist protein RsbR